MAERYTRLYSMPGQLYSEGSPVIVSAGALLKDNLADRVLAQIKFKNISLKKIKALKIEVVPKDMVGRDLGSPVIYQYLDLNVGRDQEFGQKMAIFLPDSATRSAAVKVLEAAFIDNSIWTSADAFPWENIDSPESLFEGDPELQKQYRMDINGQAKQKLQIVKDLWICSCGAVNRREEKECHKCSTSLSAMQAVDLDLLKKHCTERLEEEKAAKIEAEKRAEEERAERERLATEKEQARLLELEERKKRAAKIGKYLTAAAAVLAVIILIYNKVVIPASNYSAAARLMEEGQYQSALDSFEKLKGYKDSASLAEECRKNLLYEDAKDDMETQDYVAAVEKFQDLGDFLDSPELLKQCQSSLYSQAGDKIKKQDYAAAKEVLALLGDYEDSAQWLYMVKGIIEYINQNYRKACTLFEKVDSKFSGENKEFYDGWLSAGITMDIFSRPKIYIDDALELYKKIPESHKDDNEEFFDSLSSLKKCDGTYVYKPERSGPYDLTLKYLLEKGQVKADLSYENFSGTFEDPGDVAMLKDDKEYDFVIYITGKQSNSSRKFTIRINPEHAEVKGSGVYGKSEDCYREGQKD